MALTQVCKRICTLWPRGYKKNFMLNSAEQEMFLAHMSRKNSILGLPEPEKKQNFLGFFLARVAQLIARLTQEQEDSVRPHLPLIQE